MEPIDKKFNLAKENWKKLEEIRDALMPAKIATTILQEEQLYPGDFYGTWMKCKFDTKKAIKRPNDLASKLVA